MVRPAGLEPAAYWFEANRSIQLSYGRTRSIVSRARILPPAFGIRDTPIRIGYSASYVSLSELSRLSGPQIARESRL
jgi:hypothetical protein